MNRMISIALLAWSAGYVDALGYVSLDGVFTSHLTGNTCAIAVALVTGRGAAALLRRATMVAGFGIGGVVGTVALQRRRGIATALGVVAALLVAAAIGLHQAARGSTGAVTDALIACVAVAMGAQNIALAHRGRRSHTTHITGPFTDLMSDVTARALGTSRPADAAPLSAHIGRVGGFAAGAVIGAAAATSLGATAPLVPAAAVVLGALLLDGDR